jgi:hypothetical protein
MSHRLAEVSLGLVASVAAASLFLVGVPGNTACGANETVEPGWERSYQAGMTDPAGHYLGGSQVMHLVGHKGRLYAGNSYWQDSRNIRYGGKDPKTGWAQVLRLDHPGGSWVVDLELGPHHLRCEILKSVTFRTDGAGRRLTNPVNLLLASAFTPFPDRVEISLFTRDDATGKWTRSKVYSGEKPKDMGDRSVRAMCVHRDKVTGVDRLFLSIGKLGIFSGVYDEAAQGKVKWSPGSESGPVETRPLAIIEANGDLLFSAGRKIYRRIDGTAPSYKILHDTSDLYPDAAFQPTGGMRGLSAIPSPSGKGDSLIFAMWERNRSRGDVYRLDPAEDGTYRRTREAVVADLMSRYLSGNPVYMVGAAYSYFLPVTDPATSKTVNLFGFESWIGGHRHPTWGGTEKGGFYAGGMVAIRDEKGIYRLKEIDGRSVTAKPALVAPYCFTVSPFPADRGQTIYFGGHDPNGKASHNMAWIFSTRLENVLRP